MNNTVQAPVGGDILRDAMLQELGIYEMYQIMKTSSSLIVECNENGLGKMM